MFRRMWHCQQLYLLGAACLMLASITFIYKYGQFVGRTAYINEVLKNEERKVTNIEHFKAGNNVQTMVKINPEIIPDVPMETRDTTTINPRTTRIHERTIVTPTTRIPTTTIIPRTTTILATTIVPRTTRIPGTNIVTQTAQIPGRIKVTETINISGIAKTSPTVEKRMNMSEKFPHEIIDTERDYPDGPPSIKWPNDVTIKLPNFTDDKPVPAILHLAWYGGSTRGNYLKLHHYISMLSAYKRLKPKRILFWYDEPPNGEWWEKISATTKRVLQMVQRDAPLKIFDRPIKVPEHHSDIVRLEAVMFFGGVYVDLDVIVLKDFQPLYQYATTMGYEVSYGLCNGIIVSKPVAPFLMIWYDRYRSFDDSKWSEHSVMLPATLAKEHPTLIHTEQDTMHKPYWGELKKIYGNEKFDWTNNYSIHLWYRLHGVEHTLDEINQMNSTYGQISRYTIYDSPMLRT